VVGFEQIVDSSASDVDIPFEDELTFTWSSNISGEIGEGKSVNLSLPVGHHLVTLTVTDKEGLTATATMEIEIKPVTQEDDGDVGDDSDDLPIALILIAAIIVVVLIVALVIFLLIRKKRTDDEPDVKDGEVSPYMVNMDASTTTEEKPDVYIQQAQSPEEFNDPELELPMTETSSLEMNLIDDQVQEPLIEEQVGNDIPMEADVLPTETVEQTLQDSHGGPFLEVS
jgi:hypothetical protein